MRFFYCLVASLLLIMFIPRSTFYSQADGDTSPAQNKVESPSNQVVSEKPISQTEMENQKKILGESINWNGPRSKKMVALTFDDGPDNKYTGQILYILRKKHVHATFFVVGKMVALHPYMLKRIVKEGNSVGNHSWDHAYLPKLTLPALDNELDKTNLKVQQLTNLHMDLLRPPYGAAFNLRPPYVTAFEIVKRIKQKGFAIVNWDVDTEDWKPHQTDRSILQKVKKEVKPGSIILMHCAGGSREATVKALPKIITYLERRGYKLVTVDQLLGISAYTQIK